MTRNRLAVWMAFVSFAQAFTVGHRPTAAATPAYHVTDLGSLGGNFTAGYGINASGQVAGYSFTDVGTVRAVFFDGRLHDLDEGTGFGSNDRGHVTGASYTSGQAFVFDGRVNHLGTLGGSSSTGRGINASGQVAGYSYTSGNAALRAFVDDGSMHDIGTLGGRNSYALGINDIGQIVGDSQTLDARRHAFLYSADSGMVDLNSLIDPLSGWELNVALAINGAGQITGHGWNGSEDRAYLLTPVPEPATFALLGVGILLLARKMTRTSGKERKL